MQNTNKKLFEETPVPQAVQTMMIPTIIGALVTVLYSLADTLFVGMMNDQIQNDSCEWSSIVCTLLYFYVAVCSSSWRRYKYSGSNNRIYELGSCMWCDTNNFKCRHGIYGQS